MLKLNHQISKYFSLLKNSEIKNKKNFLIILNKKQINFPKNLNNFQNNKISLISNTHSNKKFQFSQNFYFGNTSKIDQQKEIDIKNMTAEDIERIRNRHISNKLDTIFKIEKELESKNAKEKEFVENKLKGITDKFIWVRIPSIFLIYPLAFSNPFSTTYSVLMTIANNYAIFLTLLEVSLFFSAGILNYLLNFKELTDVRDKHSFRRFSTSFIFLSVLLLSAKLANFYLNFHRLFLLNVANVIIYWKLGFHLHHKIFTRDFILQRMFNTSFNILICFLFTLIAYWKSYLYNQLA